MIYPTIPPNAINFDFPPLVAQKETFPNYEHIFSSTQQGFSFEFRLEYKFLEAEQVKTLMTFYHQVRGRWRTFSLPLSIWKHPLPIRASLDRYLRYCAFRIKEPPRVTPIAGGVYDLTVTLYADWDVSKEWLVAPDPEPPPRFTIFVQDNTPASEVNYWRNQIAFYQGLSQELTAIDPRPSIELVYLSERDLPLSKFFNAPISASKHGAAVITGGTTGYLTSLNKASRRFNQEFSLLREIYKYFLDHPEFTLDVKTYLLEYTWSGDTPEREEVKAISDNCLPLIRSGLSGLGIFDNTETFTIPDDSLGWGGVRPSLKTAIVNQYTNWAAL